jgi:hypothetical protein
MNFISTIDPIIIPEMGFRKSIFNFLISPDALVDLGFDFKPKNPQTRNCYDTVKN